MALDFSTGGPPAPTVKRLVVQGGRFVAELSDGTSADWGPAPVEADTGAVVGGLLGRADADDLDDAGIAARLAALEARALATTTLAPGLTTTTTGF